jgi:hypothetical protein
MCVNVNTGHHLIMTITSLEQSQPLPQLIPPGYPPFYHSDTMNELFCVCIKHKYSSVDFIHRSQHLVTAVSKEAAIDYVISEIMFADNTEEKYEVVAAFKVCDTPDIVDMEI